jgi:hypothetical protein
VARWIALVIALAVFVTLAVTWSVEGAVLLGAYVFIFAGVGWVTGGFGGAVSRWADRLYGERGNVGDAERHAQREPLILRRPRRHP